MRIIISLTILLLSFFGCSGEKKKQKAVFSFNAILDEDAKPSGSISTSATGSKAKSLTITPPVNTVNVGGDASYKATIVYEDGTKQDVTDTVNWSIGDSSTAKNSSGTVANIIGEVRGKGVFRGTAVGSNPVSASTEGMSATATLNVVNKTITSIQITSIPSIAVGGATQFIAVAIFDDGSTLDITNVGEWTSSNSGTASVNSNGIVSGNGGGSATISVTYGGQTGTRPITVNSVSLVSISIGGAVNIGAGATHKFTAIGTYSDGSTQDITQAVTWSSSSSAVASINNSAGSDKGFATALSAGTSTITATLGGISGSANLTVSSATLVSLAIQTNGNNSIIQGTTRPLTVIATYSDGTTADVTNSVAWSSSNSSTLSVSNAYGTAGHAYGLANGNATVTASLLGVSATANLTVEAATLTAITISGPSNLDVGGTAGYTAIGTYNNGKTQNITNSVTWNSSDSSKALIGNGINNKGVVYAQATGTTNITASLGSVTSNGVSLQVGTTTVAQTTNHDVGSYTVSLPDGLSTTSQQPSGDFNGITYTGNPAEVAGFVSTVTYGGPAGCTHFGSAILTAMASDTPDLINAWSQISAPVIGTNPNCSIVYDLSMTTKSSTTVTGLSNHLISVIGKSIPSGSVTNFPSSGANEQSDTSFRVIIQATYSSSGDELVAVGVSRADNYTANQATITSLINGTSIVPTGSSILAKTDNFTGTPDPKVDFVWVVDNSGSMSQEQASVVNNATTFVNILSNKHVDYRLGVITTGSNGSNRCTLNPTGTAAKKAWELWGTGWVYKTDSNPASAFSSNVNSVGISGCGIESGIFFAERALGGVPTMPGTTISAVTPTIEPRSGAKLVFVILSDEGDGYQCYIDGNASEPNTYYLNPPCINVPNYTAYNYSDNIFTQNNHKVFAIIGLNASGQPGTCSSGSTSADSVNNGHDAYKQLAEATGGSVASICNTDYSDILDNIATQAAASSSSYVLTQTPIASTIVVKVNGNTIDQDASNGWTYNSSTNTIVFSGSAWPAEGANIEVSYSYLSGGFAMYKNEEQTLAAYLVRTAKNHTTAFGLAIAAIAAIALFGRYAMSKRS